MTLNVLSQVGMEKTHKGCPPPPQILLVQGMKLVFILSYGRDPNQ